MDSSISRCNPRGISFYCAFKRILLDDIMCIVALFRVVAVLVHVVDVNENTTVDGYVMHPSSSLSLPLSNCIIIREQYRVNYCLNISIFMCVLRIIIKR